LRNRRVDLARLVQKEVAAVAAQASRPLGTHARLLEACLLRPWPSNVSELKACVRVAAMRAIGDGRDLVKLDDLADDAGLPFGAISAETAVERGSARTSDLGKPTLIAAMGRANGVLTVAARMLKLHRTQLIKLLDEHGIAYED
jgi:DNA-binding NtrC family response regulator